MNFKEMTKDQLRELDEKIRNFEKMCDDAADKAIDDRDFEKVGRLEEIMAELIRIESVVYARIQTM